MEACLDVRKIPCKRCCSFCGFLPYLWDVADALGASWFGGESFADREIKVSLVFLGLYTLISTACGHRASEHTSQQMGFCVPPYARAKNAPRVSLPARARNR